VTRLGLERDIVDRDVYDRSVERFRRDHIRLPTFAQIEDPARIPGRILSSLDGVDPDAPDPRNLFRVHWHNARDRRTRLEVPDHIILPRSLTGVDAPIVVLIGANFPMIASHKVLAAYGCLAPRLITGQFDPVTHRAIWPSTGNYCRGGVAISRIMDCRGVAVLPEGMSRERFDWLIAWVLDPSDVIRTPGTESNVKEIYDECARLERDPANIVFNQFCEFGNYLVHFLATGRALERVFADCGKRAPHLEPAAFVSATGSAGTLAAGDRLKESLGTRTVAVEALECPTLLYAGHGEHNIQGIGDKHVPLIHHAMNTDFVTAVSDGTTDALNVLFNTDVGRAYLADRRGVPAETLVRLPDLGLSSIANVIASVKIAKYLELSESQAVLTVATDGAPLYRTEVAKALRRDYAGDVDDVRAAEIYGQHVLGTGTDHLIELTRRDRDRIFNLGYFTWVEQQGVSLEDFDARRDPAYWTGLRDLLPAWDSMIDEFNARTGMADGA
jgi:cysteine synthase